MEVPCGRQRAPTEVEAPKKRKEKKRQTAAKKNNKKRPPQKRRSLVLTKVKHLEGTNYLLPFSVAVFVAASHVISVTPRALPRSLRPRNILSFVISTDVDAGIGAAFTYTTF